MDANCSDFLFFRPAAAGSLRPFEFFKLPGKRFKNPSVCGRVVSAPSPGSRANLSSEDGSLLTSQENFFFSLFFFQVFKSCTTVFQADIFRRPSTKMCYQLLAVNRPVFRSLIELKAAVGGGGACSQVSFLTCTVCLRASARAPRRGCDLESLEIF